MKKLIVLVVLAALGYIAYLFFTGRTVDDLPDRDEIRAGAENLRDRAEGLRERVAPMVEVHDEDVVMTVEEPKINDIEGHIWTTPFGFNSFRDGTYVEIDEYGTTIDKNNYVIVDDCTSRTEDKEGEGFLFTNNICGFFTNVENDTANYSFSNGAKGRVIRTTGEAGKFAEALITSALAQ